MTILETEKKQCEELASALEAVLARHPRWNVDLIKIAVEAKQKLEAYHAELSKEETN